jgi:threonine/homoserine/homoserine lactone efflux protein
VPQLSSLGVFVGAAVALLMIPGPAVIYIVTRSMEQGRLAGLVSVLGICSGTLFHVVAAALGISALLVTLALAFGTVRFLGAAYLVVLGVQTLLGSSEPIAAAQVEPVAMRRIFTQGVIVNLLNPHTALFFFAFLPQFVNPARGRVSLQMLALGLLFIGISAVTDSGWALAAGTAGNWIRRHPLFGRGQRYVTGGALIGLGAATAFTGNRK